MLYQKALQFKNNFKSINHLFKIKLRIFKFVNKINISKILKLILERWQHFLFFIFKKQLEIRYY